MDLPEVSQHWPGQAYTWSWGKEVSDFPVPKLHEVCAMQVPPQPSSPSSASWVTHSGWATVRDPASHLCKT